MTTIRFLLPVCLFCAACGDEASSPHEMGEDPALHACEHVAEPGHAVAASSTIEEAPTLELSEHPSTVELVPGEAGYVALGAAGDALLFVDAAELVTGLFEDGEALALPEPAPNDACPVMIPEHFDLELEGAGPYVLKLGPAGVSSVWVMYTAAAGHGH